AFDALPGPVLPPDACETAAFGSAVSGGNVGGNVATGAQAPLVLPTCVRQTCPLGHLWLAEHATTSSSMVLASGRGGGSLADAVVPMIVRSPSAAPRTARTVLSRRMVTSSLGGGSRAATMPAGRHA